MNILILNTHSVLNSGDAAIVLGQLRLLRELFGDPRIVVTSRTPESDRSFYEQLGVGVLPPLFPTPSVFASPLRGLAGCARGLVSIRGKRRLLAEIRSADLVISSGGGYFFSTRRLFPGPMFWQAYVHVAIALGLGRAVVFAPQSFGPFNNRTAASALRGLLSHRNARSVLVREEVSLEFLYRLLGATAPGRISLCPDLAFLFDPTVTRSEARPSPPLPAPVLAVTARDWVFPERRARAQVGAVRRGYLAALAGTCTEFHRRRRGSVVVFAQARGPGRLEDDRAISQELVTTLGDTIPASHLALADLPEDAPPDRVVSVVRTADVVLASRFHSAILAMVAGRPAVALGYQPKSVGMMKMMGLERYCLPMDGLDPSLLLPLIDEVLVDPARFAAEKIRPAVAEMRLRIRATMRDALLPLAAPHTGHENPPRQ